MAGQNIVKNIQVKLSLLTDKLNGATKFNKQIKGVRGQYKKLEAAGKKFNRSSHQISQALSSQGSKWKKNVGFIGENGKKLKDFYGTIKKGLKSTQRFNMNALGIMFAGMAIQKAFTSMASSATTAFTTIMESNNMMGTAVQQAAVGFEYLKFSIGSALNTSLLPLMPAIMNVISAMSEWVQAHPTLVTSVIGLGIALGTVLYIGGQMWLGIQSLIGVMGLLGTSFSAALGAAALLGLTFYILYKTIEVLTGNASSSMDAWSVNTSSTMSAITSAIGIGLKAIWGVFYTVFTGIGTLVASIMRGVLGWIESSINWILSAATEAINFTRNLLGKSDISAPTVEFTSDFQSQDEIWAGYGQKMEDFWTNNDSSSTNSVGSAASGTSLSTEDLDFLTTNSKKSGATINNNTSVSFNVDNEGMKDSMNTLLDERDRNTAMEAKQYA